MDVNSLVKKAVEDAGAIYMRATDEQANVMIDETDFQGQIVAVFENLPLIDYEVGAAIYATYPIEIVFIKADYWDPTTEESDKIRYEAQTMAQKVAVNILNAAITPTETFQIEQADQAERHDAIFTGVKLLIDYTVNINC